MPSGVCSDGIEGQAVVCGASRGRLPTGTEHHSPPRSSWILFHQKETDKFMLNVFIQPHCSGGRVRPRRQKAERPAPGWGTAFPEMLGSAVSREATSSSQGRGQSPSLGAGWRQSSVLMLSTQGKRSPAFSRLFCRQTRDPPWLGCARGPPAWLPLKGRAAPNRRKHTPDNEVGYRHSSPNLHSLVSERKCKVSAPKCLLIRGRALGQT